MENETMEQNIEKALFDLHIRFCPLVDTKDNPVKQSHCNEHKDILRSYIQSAITEERKKIIEKLEGIKIAMGQHEQGLLDQAIEIIKQR